MHHEGLANRLVVDPRAHRSACRWQHGGSTRPVEDAGPAARARSARDVSERSERIENPALKREEAPPGRLDQG
jgi:hypothetical protein